MKIHKSEKTYMILEDLVHRLYRKKQKMISYYSKELPMKRSRQRKAIYLKLFSHKEIEVLLCAFTMTVRDIKGFETFPGLRLCQEFSYKGFEALENLIKEMENNISTSSQSIDPYIEIIINDKLTAILDEYTDLIITDAKHALKHWAEGKRAYRPLTFLSPLALTADH